LRKARLQKFYDLLQEFKPEAIELGEEVEQARRLLQLKTYERIMDYYDPSKKVRA
jgi:hypothetical protein